MGARLRTLGILVGAGATVAACGGATDTGLFGPSSSGGLEGDDASARLEASADGGVVSADGSADGTTSDPDAISPDDASIDVIVTTDACMTACTCDAVTGHTFHVNPVSGNDATSTTGSGKSGGTGAPGCALKTVARALALIGSAAPNTQIIIDVTGKLGSASGESFPVKVPANVSILAGAGASPTFVVPNGVDGFHFASSGSALAGVEVNGQAGGALVGVVALAGAASKISGVDVHGFRDVGVDVQGGQLSISNGTSVHDNGTSTSLAPGLSAEGSGSVTVLGGTTAKPTSFSRNAGPGIEISGVAGLTLTGEPGGSPFNGGTVVARNNGAQGVFVHQSPGVLQNAPQCAITGVLSSQNVGAGLEVAGSSLLTVRQSVFVKNGTDGLSVIPNPSPGIASDARDISHLDFGRNHDGHNVVQDTGAPNAGAGICLRLSSPLFGATLAAQGNVFASNKSCLGSTGPALTSSSSCSGSSDVGVLGDHDKIDVASCTAP